MARTRDTKSRVSSVSLVAAVSLTVACSVPHDGTAADPVFAELVEDARAQGVSNDQLEILERAVERGSVRLADVREAVESTQECHAAAGIDFSAYVEQDRTGIEFVRYDMRVPSGADTQAAMAVSDECIREHSEFVEVAYAMQPRVVEAEERYLGDVMVPVIIACYDEYGVPYDENLGPWEQWDEAFWVIADDPESRPGDRTVAGCLKEALANVA